MAWLHAVLDEQFLAWHCPTVGSKQAGSKQAPLIQLCAGTLLLVQARVVPTARSPRTCLVFKCTLSTPHTFRENGGRLLWVVDPPLLCENRRSEVWLWVKEDEKPKPPEEAVFLCETSAR